MATFVVCLKCGRVQEIAVADQIPKSWQQSHAALYCPHCTDTEVLNVGTPGDILNKKMLYPADGAVSDDTFDEGFCEVCAGPCRGH